MMIWYSLAFALVASPARPAPPPPPLGEVAAERRWGATGHRIIARVAATMLSSQARLMVKSLLEGESMARASTWADQIRGSRRYTARWHYVNIPVTDSVWRPERYCRGNCVVAALNRELEILADSDQSRQRRTEALKWVIHLVGDISAPLHAGDRGDRGGNDLRITWEGHRTNLHRLWDGALLQPSGRDENEWVAYLERQLRDHPEAARTMSHGTPADWAMESHDVARDVVYRFIPRSLKLGTEYYDDVHAALEHQLLVASVRLAGELNRVADR